MSPSRRPAKGPAIRVPSSSTRIPSRAPVIPVTLPANQLAVDIV
ncbi:Uncharacterised protein [Mycobacteroides abscessus subsp. abscessus]|nr:Uncharacterised protein [Mycobacteroides abscessus subsp. abscessus]